MLGSQVGDGAKCKECGRLFVRTASDKQALCPHCVMAWLNDICECGGSYHYAEHLRHCPYIKRTTGTPKGDGQVWQETWRNMKRPPKDEGDH